MARKRDARKGKEKDAKPSLREIMTQALELPAELSDLSKTTLLGNKELSIQNFKGIIEYDTKIIRLNTKDFMIKIWGENLNIKTINDEDVTVNGKISGIELS